MGAPGPKESSGDTKAGVHAPAVFLSYASQDAEAAKRICDALRAAGMEVWFDKSELRGGDVWDRQIRQQIHDCRLFLPVVSANTEARLEGYFRREWKLAVDRTHDMSERVAFLVPIAIDSTSEAQADVPDAFRRVQWTRLPGGNTSPAFVERIRRLISTVPASQAPPVEYEKPRIPTTTNRPPRLARVASWVLSGVLALGLGYFLAHRFWMHGVTERPAAALAPALMPTMPSIPEKSVAVLPFVDMSEKRDQEYFSDGLSEELIDMLTKVADLRVPARTSSFYFKGRQTTIADIAKALRVAHVLEGSVRKSGNRVRVTAQLVRADNGYHLWSETYDRKLDDIFKIQDEIASAVVKALKVALLEAGTIRAASSVNSEAYDLFTQARALIRRGNQADAAIAADYLQRALKLDPTFAPAWARLTQARTFQFELGSLTYEQAIVEARRAAERAIELDPTLAAAHLAMARVHNFEWNWGPAQIEIERARRLDPGDADALRWEAIIFLTLGHAHEAIRPIQQAAELDPLNAANYSILGSTDFALRDYAAAELAYRKAIELAPPRGFGSSGTLALVLLATGRHTEALSLVEQYPDGETQLWGKALVYFALSRKAASDAALADLEQHFAEAGAMDIAEVHAYRGEADEAFSWLDRAYRQHKVGVGLIKHNWLFARLRGDPRYKEFLGKMNLPE